MHLHSFLEYLAIEKRYSRHTLTSYQKDLEQFQSFVDDELNCGLDEVGRNDVRMWIVSLQKSDYDARSINRKITALRSFYKYLQRIHSFKNNPTLYIKQLKTEKKLPVFVREEEMEELFSSAYEMKDYNDVLDWMMMRVLYDTGMRVSELIGLNEEDVDRSKKQLKVLGKRNKERFIPVSDFLLNELDAYIKEKRELLIMEERSPLFLTPRGKKLYPKFVYSSINSYLSKVTTITKRSPHVIRHTFATHLLNKGAELNAIKDILGHANLSATQVYTHNSITTLKEVYKKAHPKA